MDLEDLDLLVVSRQVYEERLVEAPFADHLGGKLANVRVGRDTTKLAKRLMHEG
jgi:hypothetical protein